MADLSATTSQTPELLRRLAVTLGAVILYRLGCWIPLPGIDVSALTGHASEIGSLQTHIERISIMGLGAMPLLSALMLAELAMIIAPGLRTSAGADASAGSFQGWIVLGTLALAGFQANGIAVALEGIPSLVPQPGLMFRAGIIVALVASTGFLLWLMAAVSRHGLGSGFLLILAMPLMLAIPTMLASQAVAWGTTSEISIPLTLAFLAATMGALVFTALRRPDALGNGQLLWPALLAYGLVGWLAVPLMLILPPEGFAHVLATLTVGHPLRWLLMGGLTLAFYALRARSLAIAGTKGPSDDRLTPFVLVAVVASAEIFLALATAPFMFDGRSIVIIAAFAIGVVAAVMALLKLPFPSERGS